MKTVYHVILDEKFIDNAIALFDRVPDTVNEYLLASKSGAISLIRQKERVRVFSSHLKRCAYIKKNKPDAVILHSLSVGAMLAALIPGKRPVVWISWGQDLYKDSGEPHIASYPFTHPLFLEETRAWKNAGRGGFVPRAKKWLVTGLKDFLRARVIPRIGYLSTCLPYEFPLIQKKYPHLRQFLFDYIDDTAFSLDRTDGKNVIVGNSASLNCNHLDVLSLMAEREIPEGKVIVPLSYAGSKKYRQAVTARGKELFGERFVPLDSFMPIEEYTRLIRSCAFAVMGFLRQQATKNIQLFLYQGTKVFFYKDTEIYRFFRDSGYRVFTIEDDLTREGLGSPLGDAETAQNRALLERDFSFAKNVENLILSMNTVFEGTARHG